MKFERITAAVVMALSAVVITAATAHAEPPVMEQPTAVIDIGAVVLEPGADATATEVPQWDAVDGSSIAIAQHTGADGGTLTPTPAAEDIAQLADISSYDRLKEQINKNLPGVVGGAIVGGLLGACMPLIWGVSIPVGVLIGGTVGGYAAGGPEFLDAVQAFVANQGR
ncbi:hypothetical protein IU427_32915 [Nocardia beijingensis]|uniref:hypothetical protein n=1 Tax=Nocardia beijingensis TaxID=95162 RepID=UPI0018953386|nr:hypothetical protein [Nocardia beijingensis]MBF6469927.1 hypothetical protein [Nocardia beijingensis]